MSSGCEFLGREVTLEGSGNVRVLVGMILLAEFAVSFLDIAL